MTTAICPATATTSRNTPCVDVRALRHPDEVARLDIPVARGLEHLPVPGARFTAIAGVDTNDQTSGGRGSVDFSVRVGGVEKFRSGVMREGMPGKPVMVELEGANEFVLQIEETLDGIACDQADWVEGRITLKDGSGLWLADLPLREGERAPHTTGRVLI